VTIKVKGFSTGKEDIVGSKGDAFSFSLGRELKL